MQLFARHLNHPDRQPNLLALFGGGLVGSAIARRLNSSGWTEAQSIAIPWDSTEKRRDALRRTLESISATVKSHRGLSCSFVWSAGRTSFYSNTTETAAEFTSFGDVLQLFLALRKQPIGPSHWHQISSAGGLFEGQRVIEPHSEPTPLGPYGELKFKQEKSLRVLPSTDFSLYRLASVYGWARRGQRCGLIPIMARNGVLGRVTKIVGRATTLRDFLWVEDVATFIARQVVRTLHGDDNTYLLASGRPVSIGEVHRQIEKCLNRRIYANFGELQNSADITFSDASIARNFTRTDLQTCIHRVCQDCLADSARIA
jgi:UDP-glucose 4-epimerase